MAMPAKTSSRVFVIRKKMLKLIPLKFHAIPFSGGIKRGETGGRTVELGERGGFLLAWEK